MKRYAQLYIGFVRQLIMGFFAACFGMLAGMLVAAPFCMARPERGPEFLIPFALVGSAWAVLTYLVWEYFRE